MTRMVWQGVIKNGSGQTDRLNISGCHEWYDKVQQRIVLGKTDRLNKHEVDKTNQWCIYQCR